MHFEESDSLNLQRREFETHLQRLRAEMAQTSAAMSSQVERFEQQRTGRMYAEIRRYSGQGARTLFDLIEEFRTEIESLMQSIPGFVSYSLFRTADGGASFTICNDKAGVDQSAQIAHHWIIKNAKNLRTGDPEIVEGKIVAHVQ